MSVVLCINSGSSSLKLALYQVEPGAAPVPPPAPLARAAVERIGLDGGKSWLQPAGAPRREQPGRFPDHAAAVQAAVQLLTSAGLPAPEAVGHRLVHGGPDHLRPERVDGALLATLRQLVPFAPLHMPSEILGIEAVAAHYPGMPQVVCFDTAFHRRMPEVAKRLALPRPLFDQGVRRYGFHGLSYESIVELLGHEASGRLVVAHLGNGASMAAIRDGQPVDTTMGLTPVGGLVMGTRTGDLDPGVLVHLMRNHGYDADGLEDLVNRRSGLLGVSGQSPDMRTLLEARAHDPAAAQAVELFVYTARKHLGALAAALGGIDQLVFTGGIGERAAPVRAEICQGLAHLGISVDDAANQANSEVISRAGAPCTVRVMETHEELMIARHTVRTLATRHSDPSASKIPAP